jgi:integrase
MFKKIIKENGFPDVHAHDLRHACASLLINMGVPTKLISEHLGHADTRTTEQVYSHIFAATRSKASDAISLALKGKEDDYHDAALSS